MVETCYEKTRPEYGARQGLYVKELAKEKGQGAMLYVMFDVYMISTGCSS